MTKVKGMVESCAPCFGVALIAGLIAPGAVSAEDLTWDSDPGSGGIQSGDGDWAEGGASNPNWQTGGSNTNFDDGDTVSFSAPGGGTITLQEDVAPASITFVVDGYTIDSAAAAYQIAAHGLPMTINVVDGSATIAAGISNKGTVTITGAGSLTLSGVNTDDGAAAAGVYDIDGGNLVITGSTAAEDPILVTNSSGRLDINDGGEVGANVSMTANGSIDNFGTVGANVILSDGEFRNGNASGADTGTVEGTVTLNGANADFVNNQGSSVDGLVTVNNGTLSASGGSFADILVDGGRMTVSDDTTADSVKINVGNIDIQTGQNLTTTLNMGGGVVDNDGTTTGTVTVTSGTFNNGHISGIPSGTVAGDVDINGASATFNNNVGSDVTGTVTIDNEDGDPATGGTLNGNGGTFGDVVVTDGRFNVNASTQADSVTNGGGRIEIDGTGITLTTDYNQTGGTTVVANGGELADADGLTISGGELQNNIGSMITGDVAVSGGELLANGGTFNDDVTVSGTGTFNVDTNTSVGTTTITDGDIDIANGATLATNLDQRGGTTKVNSGGQLDDTDGSVDMSGGTLTNQGTVIDDIELTGDARLVADGGVFNGDITMLGGDTVFDVNASTLIPAPITVTNGTLNINGTSTLTNDLDLGNGTVNVGADATLTDVNGILLDSGTLANAGTVNGVVTVANGGSLDIAGGAFTNGVLANGGNILISEDSTLDLTNNGSDIVIESGRTLTDEVDNISGTITSAGTINGTLNITGGTVTVEGSGELNGDVTNSGTLQSAGTITGDVGNTGTLELEGTLSGTLDNDGAGTITTTGNVTGITTLTQNSTGLITVSDGDTLSAQTINITAGSAGIDIGAGATLEGLGNSITNAATMTFGAGGGLRDAGSITNQSGAEMLFGAGGFLIGDSDGIGGEDILNDGTITLGGGTLNVSLGGAGVFSNANVLTLASGSSMNVSGRFANSGTINMQNGRSSERITVNGDYTGGGTMLIDVDFAAATADRMVVNGDVTGGTTTVSVNDVSSGAATGNDIVIASVSGTSAADAFVMASPISLGAFVYNLEQEGSNFVLGATGGFAPEVVGLEALATTLVMQSDMPTLRQRSGIAMSSEPDEFGRPTGLWLSIDAATSRFAPLSSGTGYRGSADEYRVRGGLNFDLLPSDAERLVLGTNLSWGSFNTDLSSRTGAATISTTALSAGLSATWYGETGFYLDGQVQYTALDSTIASGGFVSNAKGRSYSGALEIGQRLNMGDSGWVFTPRGQLRYTRVDFNDFTSGGGLPTSLVKAESKQVGLGLNTEYTSAQSGAPTLFSSAMIYRDFAGDATTLIAGTPFTSDVANWTGEFGLGVKQDFGSGLGSLFGEVSYTADLSNPSAFSGVSMKLGAELTF